MPLCLPPLILLSKHWLLWEPAGNEGCREPAAKKGQEGCSIFPAGFLLYHSVCLSEASPAFLLISLFSVSPSLGDAVPVKFHFLSFFLSLSLCFSVSLFISVSAVFLYVCMYVSLPSLSIHFPPLLLPSPQTPAALAAHAPIWSSGDIQRGPLAKVT